MVFSYLTFIYIFLPLCLLAYFILPTQKIRNGLLAAASLLFYALGEPAYVVLLVAAAGSAFVFALYIDRWRGTRRARARLLLALSLCVNVGALFFFKYVPLFAETAAALLGAADVTGAVNVAGAAGVVGMAGAARRMALPIGISFYTFQILTYTLDVYSGKTPLQRSPVKFLLYVSMFPQLIAGPIVRYSDIAGQLDAREVNVARFSSGVTRFVCGLGKKLLLADYAGLIADGLLGGATTVTGGTTVTGVTDAAGAMGAMGAMGAVGAVAGAAVASDTAGGISMVATGAAAAAGGISTAAVWFGLFAFAFQIYFDFSGYSDMAIGLGRMFGFDFRENFNYPYCARSVTDFWRRWHISLGTFFRDYVYIPLGGNRRYQLRNIAVVWILTGFWHGAGWNFVLWGCWFGVLLIFEKYALSRIPLSPPAPLRAAYSFILVVAGWCVFYYTDLGRAFDALRAMFTFRPETDFRVLNTIRENALFLAACFFMSMPWAKRFYNNIFYDKFVGFNRRVGIAAAAAHSVLSFAYVTLLLIACSAAGVASSFSPFLYFRF